MKIPSRVPMALARVCLIASAATFAPHPTEAKTLFGSRDKAEEAASSYSRLVASGQFEEASRLVESQFNRRAAKASQDGDADPRSLQLYLLQATALAWAGDSQRALGAFELADTAIKDYETRVMGGGALEAVGAAFGGSKVKRYRPKTADGILVNTYKALLFMASAKTADARVELHRADERTRRAVELFAKEIEREAEQNPNGQQPNAEQVASLIGQHYPEVAHWEVYEGFVNPYSVYLHALYFFGAGEGASDLEKSSSSIKRVAGMYPNSHVLAGDIEMIEQVASGRASRDALPDFVWVICEDGLAPRIATRVVDVVLPVDNRAVPVRLALQDLRPMPEAAGGCTVRAEGTDFRADEIASMDRIVQTEFRKRLPAEVSQAVVGAIARGAIQHQAQKRGGVLGLVGGVLHQEATVDAETRVWEGLPKAWYAVRVPRPASGVIEVLDPRGRPIITIHVPEARVSLAQIRLPSSSAKATSTLAVLRGSPSPLDQSLSENSL